MADILLILSVARLVKYFPYLRPYLPQFHYEVDTSADKTIHT